MLQLGTSGLMSGEGKPPAASRFRSSALPRLYTYYPPDYWKPSENNLHDWLRQKYRRLVLSDRVHFVERALSESQELESEARGIVLDVGCGDGFLLGVLADRGRGPVV